MSRVDRPRIKCDRSDCGLETEDLSYMGRYIKLNQDHMSGRDSWDLCPSCWTLFLDFVGRERE